MSGALNLNLSHSFGVQDIDAFLTTIAKSGAEIFSARPKDLIELIDYWKQHGKIANRAEMHEKSITSKLKEADPNRSDALPLSSEDTRHGAEMIAAAITFLKKNRILIPEQNVDHKIKSTAFDPQEILKNWDLKQIRALLQRPLFDKAIYGTVRFHYRSEQEYLTT